MAYWKTELAHISWGGTRMKTGSTPKKKLPIDTARLQIDTSQPDGPFISPTRPVTTSQTIDQRYRQSLPPQKKAKTMRDHHRGGSLLTSNTFRDNDEVQHHPQPQGKRPESVPNYSRPLTPDVRQTPVRPPRSSWTINSRFSNQPVYYETVNGVEFDMTPHSTKERRQGLSIPELEARDLTELEEWLHHFAPVKVECASAESHSARPPPPIGRKENSVRAISPQPPSAGKHHTFVSRYSWPVEEKTEDNEKLEVESTPRIASQKSQTSRGVVGTPARTGTLPARELLTEIIREVLVPTKTPSRSGDDTDAGENESRHSSYTHRDFPPDYSSLQPRDRPGYLGENSGFLRYTDDGTYPDSGYYTQSSYRKRISSYGRNAVKFLTMRHGSICGRFTC